MPPNNYARVSWSQVLIEKYILPFILAISIAFVTGGWSFYIAVHDLTSLVNHHDAEIKGLQSDLNAIRTNSITRSELLEILKRVEQQLEIMTLKAKVQEKIKLTER
jgi:hypothetical protein